MSNTNTHHEGVVLVGVIAAMALLVLAGWAVITEAHMYFGVLWVPLALLGLYAHQRSARVSA